MRYNNRNYSQFDKRIMYVDIKENYVKDHAEKLCHVH